MNYQVDGNTNTQRDRAGLRMMPMSEVMIQEVQVVTSGFAPGSATPRAWSTTP